MWAVFIVFFNPRAAALLGFGFFLARGDGADRSATTARCTPPRCGAELGLDLTVVELVRDFPLFPLGLVALPAS